MEFESKRLRFRPVDRDALGEFHGLVEDEHVRRYLVDGKAEPPSWSEARVRDSESLLASHGIGLWLAYEKASGELVGFCGFLVIPSARPEPQLLYAIRAPFTGQGYATEMASAAIQQARAGDGFEDIYAGVDEPNLASRRVLEKLGFEEIATLPGSFGKSFLLRLTGPPKV